MRLMVLAILNKFRLFLGVLFALILCQSTLFAQISAPTSSYNSTTQYTSGTQDEIFVFCDEAGVDMGELKAVSHDAISGWDFTWTKWDSGTNTFGAPIKTDNSDESVLGNLSNGLYRVVVNKGTETRTYQAWVINHLKNTNQPSFTKTDMDCVGVHFSASYVAAKYQYFDFPSSNLLELSTTSIFSFKRNGIELQRITFADYNGSGKSFIDDEAFLNVADYTMTVIDECDFEYHSDPISSKTYAVDATFTFNPATGEAPLEVSFETKDANATDYRWFFYKNSKVEIGVVPLQDSLLTEVKIGENETFTYLHPGKYLVKLIATNNDDSMNCIDVFTSSEITVEGSIFEVPNVFTPNGDGKNDKFHLKLYSVKSYSAKIFNRWGRLVYEFQESDVSTGLADRKSSKGWDGKINGKLAAPGTYFYVIEAEGREEDGKHYTEKGSLTLLHDK
ncbi:hypothetical protein DWB61_07230 [Ancylomarina euxinus]|uniref:Gliding motility-associated C-terminal domain-containing protein n=1 Tax=Ancylomarina euxinus TaxID=2283627 RepID=A0A425Y355_9BACT|nr:gliding motility-associated C-terminal domain-containing protein [Ancylomarina euxinus]MCZ4693135.1 gliding motility-associated C-terminal domain-containing protein [Ancylomarina euxinus]MUP15273.1 T9SS type B sorting domain-containing protein [Ancylomarina euxinus]RRG22597.1 hypothetical protein DWB61_07230 [Ancylomarina euxinus]